MSKKQCPKCKAIWPEKQKYCVCGQKLYDPIDFVSELLGVDLKSTIKDNDNGKS